MGDTALPEIDRRKKDLTLREHVIETLIGKQSRKVAFGIWLFLVSNAFKAKTDMPWDIWWKCVLLAGAMIGLGTVLDDTIAKFGDLIAVFGADKVKTVFAKKTETTVVSTDAPAPQ